MSESENKVSLGDKNILNIVLFGETGVGKSTFVNAFANYLKYDTLIAASNGELLAPVPIKFTVMDENFQEKVIQIGKSENEKTDPGVSSTQHPKSYLLEIPEKNLKIRLIDTPGIGDTRGLKFDEENMEKILALLGELNHVNAFCVLVKPNNSRITVLFEHCMKHLFSKLDKKVFENFVFIFTNARSSFFTPGDTFLPLQILLEGIASEPHKIKFDRDNIFCIDNESIRYLAIKNKGIKINDNVEKDYQESYQISSNSIKRMIDYIKTLSPASMKDTLSINDSRRIIFKLAIPMIDVMEKCEDAKDILIEHERKINENENNLEKLKPYLYIPVVKHKIEEKRDVEHKKGTIKPYLDLSWTPPFISVGVKTTTRRKIVVTTIQTPYVLYVEASNIKSTIDEKERAKATMVEIKQQLKKSLEDLEKEENLILTALVKFTVFLKENAFLMGADIFKNDLTTLIKKEREIKINPRRLESYENLLSTYLDEIANVSNVTPQDVDDVKTELLKQKHFGDILKYYYELDVLANDTTIN
ncbi:uncharacterized protein [Onthophagus taurus]|uniref:uncharacterized protein n=1 Tax=Onthophagus taurus TaxID=166361 RepID=UPI0039BDDD34